MNMTSAVEMSIQAVSPLSMVGAEDAAGSSARTPAAASIKTASTRGKMRRLTMILRHWGALGAHQHRGEEEIRRGPKASQMPGARKIQDMPQDVSSKIDGRTFG